MNFVESILSKLFPERDEEEPFLSERIVRSASEQINYFSWVKSKSYKKLSGEFYVAYFLKKRKINSGVNLQIFHSRFANAVSVFYNHHILKKDFHYYFDFLRDAVMKLGYELQYSEREIIDRHRYLETVERYYLTFPENLKIGGRKHQLYGNILLEQIMIDQQPSHLKIVASYYPESDNYYPPLNFDEMIDKLFAE
jgi:hypothetical protein